MDTDDEDQTIQLEWPNVKLFIWSDGMYQLWHDENELITAGTFNVE